MQIETNAQFIRTRRALIETRDLVAKFDAIVTRRDALNIPDDESKHLLATYKQHAEKLSAMLDAYPGAQW